MDIFEIMSWARYTFISVMGITKKKRTRAETQTTLYPTHRATLINTPQNALYYHNLSIYYLYSNNNTHTEEVNKRADDRESHTEWDERKRDKKMYYIMFTRIYE